VAALFLAILISAVLLWLPPQLVRFDAAGHSPEFVMLVDKYRATLAQALGGFAIIAGLYFTARNVLAAEQTRWTKTFSDSIGQLGVADADGQPVTSVRVGAIYSLERLSRDSPNDAKIICNVLLQYIQARATIIEDVTSPNNPKALYPLDCEAALIVLGEIRGRVSIKRDDRLMLVDAFLPNLVLTGRRLGGFHFKRVVLSGSRLDGCRSFGLVIEDSTIEGCSFAESNLSAIELNLCRGQGVSFSSAVVRKSRFLSSTLRESDFTYARLVNAELADSDFTGSDFSNCDMRSAIISNCIMDNVRFDNANLDRVDFRTATGITAQDIAAASVKPPRSLLPVEWRRDDAQ
jgi:hypothetical protein